MKCICLFLVAAALAQSPIPPHVADIKRAALFPFNTEVESSDHDIWLTLMQRPGDPSDHFEAHVRATVLAGTRAMVTVYYEMAPEAALAKFGHNGSILLSKQGITTTAPVITSDTPAVAEFCGIARTAVRSVTVALVTVNEMEKREFSLKGANQ